VIKAVALGLALVVTVLLTGCGVIVTDEAPAGDIRASAPALLMVFRSRLGQIGFAETARTFLRVTVASAALAAVAYPLWYVLDQALGRSVPAQVVALGSAFVAGFGVYLISCRLLGVRELNTLLSLRGRFRRG